jgi:hypothetical protein
VHVLVVDLGRWVVRRPRNRVNAGPRPDDGSRADRAAPPGHPQALARTGRGAEENRRRSLVTSLTRLSLTRGLTYRHRSQLPFGVAGIANDEPMRHSALGRTRLATA